MARDDLVRSLKLQAAACANMGSAFSSQFLTQLADDVADGGYAATLLAAFVEDSTKQLIDDAVPLRILGAFHDLSLSGAEPALSAAYPSAGFAGDAATAWAIALEVAPRHGEQLIAFTTHEPQTNEVRRSVALLGGFLTLAKETGLPLRSFEIAASAGLNQFWDRYHYDLGEAGLWGDPASPVRLDTDWTGPAPPLVPVTVAQRAACDRAPVDIREPGPRRRLTAYIWADQPERLVRLRAAIDVALAAGVDLQRSDAAAWAKAIAAPQAGFATVLYHSVFWTYMSEAQKAELLAVIDGLAAQATPAAPFAWLRMEPTPETMTVMEIRLTMWPGGEERLLARSHPHGATVEWLG